MYIQEWVQPEYTNTNFITVIQVYLQVVTKVDWCQGASLPQIIFIQPPT